MLFATFQKQIFNQYATLLGLIALVLFLPSIAKAERLPVKTYTVADGLLRDNVLKIKQDSRGFLWFCTDEGVSRFDGEGFTNFTTDDGLPDRHANDFLETRDGAIYLATDKGLARLNPNGIRGSKDNPLFSVFLTGNPRAGEFHVLFEDTSGEIFCGTGDGLYKFKNDGFEQIVLSEPNASKDRLKITSIIKDRRSALWIATEAGGLIHISAKGETRRFNHQDGLPNNKITALHDRLCKVRGFAKSRRSDIFVVAFPTLLSVTIFQPTGETATFIWRCLFNSELRVTDFAPRQLNRQAAVLYNKIDEN